MLKRKSRKTFFTTPSHGGKLCICHKFYQWYRSDISETEAYKPQEELLKAEAVASVIYGTSVSFLTNGATSGVIAAVLACCGIKDRQRGAYAGKNGNKILVWNNSHPCHKNAVRLAGAETVEYVLRYNEEWGIYEGIKTEEDLSYIESLIKKHTPVAIIVTSPSYEGIVSNVPEISKICKKYGVYLIADEAHGALYPFSPNLPESAIHYADFTVQSLHKTAGGINPTALLHSNCAVNPKPSLNMISTTSPSYPMLATIEANVRCLNSQKGRQKIEDLITEVKKIKSALVNFEFYGDDATKILMKKGGVSGYQLSQTLYNKYNIEDERANEKSVLLLTGLGTIKDKLQRLRSLAHYN